MNIRPTFVVVPQRLPRAVSALQCLNYSTQCPNSGLRRRRFQPQPYRASCYLLARHASTSTAAAAKTSPGRKQQSKATHKPSKPSAPPPQRPSSDSNEKLNPPESTYPPPLSVPERKPGQSYFSYLWGAGRAYVNFYKTGVGNVRSTVKLARQLRKRQKEAGPGEKDTILTRAEWQIVRRSKADLLRLPPFAVILLVFGEWTPLLVLWLTPIVPEACRIPSQTRKSLKTLESRRREREQTIATQAAQLIHRDRRPGVGQSTTQIEIYSGCPKQEDIDRYSLYELLYVSTRLDAHSWLWEYYMTPPKAILRWGMKRKLEYLNKDDELILRDGGFQELSREETHRACIERGIYALDKSDHELKKRLAEWFGKRKR